VRAAFSLNASIVIINPDWNYISNSSETTNAWNKITNGAGSNINFTMPANVASGSSRIYGLNLTTPIIVTGAAVGTTNASQYVGPNVYAAFAHRNDATETAPNTIGTARSGTTGFVLTPASNTSTAETFDMLLVFKKADFAGGLHAGPVGFDDTSVFSISTATYNANTKSLRAVVQVGSSWYISVAENTTPQAAANPKVILSNAAAASWVVWDPTTSIALESINFAAPTVLGSSFTDIQAVGIYGHMVKSSESNLGFTLSKFEVSAVAVPEPATIAVLLGLCALGFVAVHRRR
jgi:hypothetical protein